ncbi:hypothetical protein Tco_0199576 [Tanacetum coccineum]
MISPAFVEENYEDYDEEREIELRPEPNREATSTLRSRSSMVLRERERVVRFEETSNMERSRRGRNAKGVRPTEIEAKNRRVNLPLLLAAHLGRNESCQPLRFSLTSIQGGHQPLTNMQGSLPPNYTLLSHHAQPFIPSSLHTPTRLVPIHVNPLLSTICGPCQWANSEFPFSKPNSMTGVVWILKKSICMIYMFVSAVLIYLLYGSAGVRAITAAGGRSYKENSKKVATVLLACSFSSGVRKVSTGHLVLAGFIMFLLRVWSRFYGALIGHNLWDIIVYGDLHEEPAPTGDQSGPSAPPEAIKSRSGGNEESKKMQKNVLKHQFENFTTTPNEILDKAYDRFQKLISQLEAYAGPVLKEDINQKFLRSLPPSWSQIALIMRNKLDIDQTDIDDLYNNLRVY